MPTTGHPKGVSASTWHRWTPEQLAFMRRVVRGRSYAETTELVNARFGLELKASQIASCIGNHGMDTGRTGRFEKGHVPPNKGRRGYCAPGSEKGHFKKGNVSFNRVPIGTEKRRADGYVWVKIQDGHKNANWRQKHVLAWEAANGPVPDKHCVMLIDGDATNCALENLILVHRNDLVRFNHMGMQRGADGVTEAGVLVARLHNTIAERKRGRA